MSWRMRSKLLEPELRQGHQAPDPVGQLHVSNLLEALHVMDDAP